MICCFVVLIYLTVGCGTMARGCKAVEVGSMRKQPCRSVSIIYTSPTHWPTWLDSLLDIVLSSFIAVDKYVSGLAANPPPLIQLHLVM